MSYKLDTTIVKIVLCTALTESGVGVEKNNTTVVPEHILIDANDTIDWLRTTTESLKFPRTEKFITAAACFAVAQDHHESIVLLAEHRLFASSFALVRVAFDAHVRGVWLRLCAIEKEIKKFIAHVEPPNTGLLVLEIEKNPEYAGAYLSRYKRENYKWLCDYTHTGGRQTQRWSGVDAVEPNYALQEVLEVMATSQSIAIMSLLGVIAMCDQQDVAISIIERIKVIQGLS